MTELDTTSIQRRASAYIYRGGFEVKPTQAHGGRLEDTNRASMSVSRKLSLSFS